MDKGCKLKDIDSYINEIAQKSPEKFKKVFEVSVEPLINLKQLLITKNFMKKYKSKVLKSYAYNKLYIVYDK